MESVYQIYRIAADGSRTFGAGYSVLGRTLALRAVAKVPATAGRNANEVIIKIVLHAFNARGVIASALGVLTVNLPGRKKAPSPDEGPRIGTF